MSVRKTYELSLMVALAAGVAPLSLVPVWAADAPANESESASLEEIIVTAQKRAQNLQDVGTSITALGTESLAALGHQDVAALVQQVPSMQVSQYSPNVTVFNLRGVSQNDFSDGQEAPIAFYNDEVYIGGLGAISGQTFDLARVEVLRGPQGTLFGRNATGGLVQAITAKPNKDLEGFASITGGSFGQIASEAAVGGPLTDHIRARVSLTTNDNDGYLKNPIGPTGRNSRFYAGRAQAEADVGDHGTLLLKFEYMRNDHERTGPTHISAGINAQGLGFPLAPDQNFWGTCPGCDLLGYKASSDPFTSSLDYIGLFNRTWSNTLIRYDQDLGFAKLTSLSDYQNMRKFYGEDSDVGPIPGFITEDWQSFYQLSQELRLSGANDWFSNWVVGLYALKIHSYNPYRVGTPEGTDPAAAFFIAATSIVETKSAAAFAQAEHSFNPVLSAILGLRYSADWKKDDFTDAANGFPLIDFNTNTYPGLAAKQFRSVSGKFEVDVKPTHGVLLYASVNRGTKSGGFGAPTFPPFTPESIPFKQEVLTNYEGGYKLTLADNKLTVDGSVFHYVYQDYQAFSNINVSQVITNHPATINGMEIEIAARPTPHLRFNAFATRLFTARVADMAFPNGDVASTRMPQAPDWSFGGGASYNVNVGFGALTAATNWKYDGVQYFSAFDAPIDREGGHAVGDFRLTFVPAKGSWEVAVFANNVTNKAYRLFDLDLSQFLGVGQSDYAPPRWFGGTVTYHFQ